MTWLPAVLNKLIACVPAECVGSVGSVQLLPSNVGSWSLQRCTTSRFNPAAREPTADSMLNAKPVSGFSRPQSEMSQSSMMMFSPPRILIACA
jgi:hypothetical protein